MPATNGAVTITANSQGHYIINGTINGSAVLFMVDTGATSIAIGPSDARRMGVDLRKAARGLSQTANGSVATYRVKLASVTVGGITLHQVDAVVLPKDQSMALLGMSWLGQMEIHHNGAVMTISRR